MSLLFRLFRYYETRVHQLNYLFWECTTRCNLHCRHCGSDCFTTSSDKDMPLEDFLAALDTVPPAIRTRDFTVVLTGGEPLLRPDIADIGKSIRRRGVGWSMVSNGFLYDERMHGILMGAGLGALTVSLDGLEDRHDWMRGRKGSFSNAVRAIRIAAAEPFLNFDVVTCVHRRNIHQLQEIFDLLVTLKVRQWRIFTIIPIGRAKDDPDMQLTRDESVPAEEYVGNALHSRTVLETAFITGTGTAVKSSNVMLDIESQSKNKLFKAENLVGPPTAHYTKHPCLWRTRVFSIQVPWLRSSEANFYWTEETRRTEHPTLRSLLPAGKTLLT